MGIFLEGIYLLNVIKVDFNLGFHDPKPKS